MAHSAEPMDIDDISEFDNKENSFHHSNVQQSTEKGYEELDVSELNMKLRYSFTPASSPMSKSYTACLDNKSQDSDDLNNTVIHENENLTQSLNATRNETLVKSPKLLPLQALSSDQIADASRNASVLRPLDGTITVEDGRNITVTVTEANDSDENISFPSTSSSPVSTPEGTTPAKDAVKTSGSPIMRGLKTVMNLFRPSQSPIPPDETDIQNTSQATNCFEDDALSEDTSIKQYAIASTPIAGSRKERDTGTSKRSSPLKESLVFKEDLEKELQWNDDSTIIFSSKEKFPIHKLLFQPAKTEVTENNDTALNLGTANVSNIAEKLETSVTPMDISYNDSILRDKTMTEVQSDTLIHTDMKEVVSETDTDRDESLFLDCESTFISMNETELLSDTKDNIAADFNAENNIIENTNKSIATHSNIPEQIQETNTAVEINLQEIDIGHKEIINNEPLSQSIDIAGNLAPLPENSDDNTPKTPTNESVRSKTIDFIIQSSLALMQDSKENSGEVCNADLEVSQQIIDKTVDNTKTVTNMKETIDLIKVSELPLPSDDEFDNTQVNLNIELVNTPTDPVDTVIKDTGFHSGIDFSGSKDQTETVLNKVIVDLSKTVNTNYEIETTEVISSNLPESIPMPAEVADSVLYNINMPVPSTSMSSPETLDVTTAIDDTTENLNSLVKNLSEYPVENEIISTTKPMNALEPTKSESEKDTSNGNNNNIPFNTISEVIPQDFEVSSEVSDNSIIAVTENIQTDSVAIEISDNLVLTKSLVRQASNLMRAGIIVTESDNIDTQSSDGNVVSRILNENATIVYAELELSELDVKASNEILQSKDVDNLMARDLNLECNETDITNIDESTHVTQYNDVVPALTKLSPAITDSLIVDNVPTKSPATDLNDKTDTIIDESKKDSADDTIVKDTRPGSPVLEFNDEIYENVVMNTTPDMKPNAIKSAGTTITETSNIAQYPDGTDKDLLNHVQSVAESVSINDEHNCISLNNQNNPNNTTIIVSEQDSVKQMEISRVESTIKHLDEPMNVTLTKQPIEDDKKENDDLDDEIILSESNSPYVSLSAQTNEPTEQPVESFEDIRMSPPICSKGYNINFDDLDNQNLFISKSKVRLSPPPVAKFNQTFVCSDEVADILKSTVQTQLKVQLNELNTTKVSITEESTNNLEAAASSNETSNIVLEYGESTELVNEHTQISPKEMATKIVEQVTKDANSIMNVTTTETVLSLTDTKICRAEPKSKVEHYIGVGDIATKEGAFNSTILSDTRILPPLEQSIYFSAGTSSEESSEKQGYTLPDFDEMNINPFATKNKMRQSPQPGLEVEDPFETKSKIALSRDASPAVVNTKMNLKGTINVIEDKLPSKNNLINETPMTKSEFNNTVDNNINTNSSGSSKDEKEKTVEEEDVHTEDEETLEGPFIDAEFGDDIDKMSDFESEKVELNVFTEQSTHENDENFEAGEMFIDADAFELFMNKNKSNEVVDNGKDSLFLKFDPLFAKRVNSDGVVDVLSKLQKRQSTPKKMRAQSPKKDLMLLDNSPVAGPSNENDGYITPDESSDELNVTVSQKPTMAVPPAVNPVVTPRKKATTPVRTTSRLSMNFTSPAMAVIDRLLSLSGTFSPVNQDITMPQASAEQYEADRALIQLRELLAEKELNVHHLRGESKELRDRLDILESQMSTLEKEGEKRLKHINELNEKLSEKNKENKGMSAVVEEYEKTIAGLISGIEEDKKRHSEERTQLINERDEQTAHLASMEVAFSDLHSKYEKSKQVIMSYKAKEDTYRKSIQEFEENLEKMQNNYELLKQHATSKLNHANTELEKINRSHESEVLKLNAMIKRKDLHISSLEETLAQKTKANEELTAICDELINKVG